MPFVAIDLLGTLFTFDRVIEKIQETLSSKLQTVDQKTAKMFFEYWYNYALRDYIACSQAGKYRSLRRVLEATFTRALLCYFDNDECSATEGDMEAIMASFDAIEPDPLVCQALEKLKDEGTWDIWILTTAEYARTIQLLDEASLTHFIGDNILCCDNLRISKPHPKVYSEMMRLAVHKTKCIENFYMIGSNAFDLAGAKNISIRTVFLDATEKVYPAQMYDTGEPDIVGKNLVECVTKMIEFERVKRHI